MHIAILDAVPKIFWHCDNNITDAEKFIDFLTPVLPNAKFNSFYVAEGKFPNNLEQFDCFLITGSPCSVNDGDEWITRLEKLIHSVIALNIPLVGLCFGHQIITKALGGKVSANERGWNIRLFSLHIEQTHPWMQPKSDCTSIYHFNKERITSLPDSALSFAHSEGYPFFGYTVGDKIVAIQGHPEQPKRAMLNFLNCVANELNPNIANNAFNDLSSSIPNNAIWATWIANYFHQSINKL